MIFSIILSAWIFLLSFGTTAVLMLLISDICWAPRVGGTIVGLSVFLQGYIFANPEKFQGVLRNGITREQRIMHVVYVSAVFGTLLWAWGDLMPEILWVENTACLN